MKVIGDSSCRFSGPEDLLEWVRSFRGGHVDRRIEVSESGSSRGITAKAAIRSHEVIVKLPWELVLSEDAGLCSLVDSLRAELSLGRCSKLWPWIRALNDVDIPLPTAWPKEALDLIRDLPPGDWTSVHDEYKAKCGNSSDPLVARSLLLVKSRACAAGLAPVQDMFNHRESPFANVELEHVPGNYVKVRTIKDIAQGEELYIVYKNGHSSAPEIFRDYGFVEQSPSTWFFKATGSKFLFEVMNEAGEVHWPKESKTTLQTFAMFGQMKLESTMAQQGEKKADVPSPYREMAQSYRDAFSRALRAALAKAALETKKEL